VSGIIAAIVNFLGGNAAGKVASGAVNAAAGVALVAAATPAALWFVHNKDEVFVTMTYAQTIIVAGIVFAFIKMAHYTQAPKPPGS
jgi:hypothetical protein